MNRDPQSDRDNARALGLLQDAIESLSEGFALYDEDRRLVMCNTQYREMNKGVADLLEPGLDWEILMRESARRGIYAEAIGREEEFVRDRLQTSHDYVHEYELKQTDGTYYHVSTHPTNLGGFVITRTDITRKKQVEAMEREGDLLVRTVLDASAAVVIMSRTGDGQILYRSPAALEMFGNTRSSREHYLYPDDRADFVTQMLADGQIDDFPLTMVARGRSFPATISARFAEYHGDEVIVASVTDLTEQVKAQAMIRQVLESCPVPLQMTRAETGETLYRSAETEALLGSSGNAKTYYKEPGEREAYLAELREKGFVRNRRAKYINAQGEEFWGAASSVLIEFDGEEVIVSSTRDLTDELALQEELAHQREMLFQNEKMSALGELLAGVAHELNNPLSVIVGHALMLMDEVGDPDVMRRVEKISNAAERSAKIVKTFLAMARQQPARVEHVDVRSVVATALDVAGYGHKLSDLEIVTDLPEGLADILADPDQITQVVINLVINAAHAIESAGTGDRITVAARRSERGRSVTLSVADNGPGIDEAIRARVFEPFFTTKDIGDGTGIGLAFCHRIVHSHGGRIWLDPDHAPGSRFCISLPAARGAAEALAEEAEAPAPGRRRALVVDDEADVAELIAEVLTRDGFSVDTAHSGAEAVQLLAQRRYDLLLSDLNMAGMDGRALYEHVTARHPELAARTGFITGDTMGRASQALLGETRRPHLEKPVTPGDLRRLVRVIFEEGTL